MRTGGKDEQGNIEIFPSIEIDHNPTIEGGKYEPETSLLYHWTVAKGTDDRR
jgi:hypothetical protein